MTCRSSRRYVADDPRPEHRETSTAPFVAGGRTGRRLFRNPRGSRFDMRHDACDRAIEFGKPALMRDDRKKVFEPDGIAAGIERIT